MKKSHHCHNYVFAAGLTLIGVLSGCATTSSTALLQPSKYSLADEMLQRHSGDIDSIYDSWIRPQLTQIEGQPRGDVGIKYAPGEQQIVENAVRNGMVAFCAKSSLKFVPEVIRRHGYVDESVYKCVARDGNTVGRIQTEPIIKANYMRVKLTDSPKRKERAEKIEQEAKRKYARAVEVKNGKGLWLSLTAFDGTQFSVPEGCLASLIPTHQADRSKGSAWYSETVPIQMLVVSYRSSNGTNETTELTFDQVKAIARSTNSDGKSPVPEYDLVMSDGRRISQATGKLQCSEPRFGGFLTVWADRPLSIIGSATVVPTRPSFPQRQYAEVRTKDDERQHAKSEQQKVEVQKYCKQVPRAIYRCPNKLQLIYAKDDPEGLGFTSRHFVCMIWPDGTMSTDDGGLTGADPDIEKTFSRILHSENSAVDLVTYEYCSQRYARRK